MRKYKFSFVAGKIEPHTCVINNIEMARDNLDLTPDKDLE